jgi:hypothetical protein
MVDSGCWIKQQQKFNFNLMHMRYSRPAIIVLNCGHKKDKTILK